jgi:hypothetical protein
MECDVSKLLGWQQEQREGRPAKHQRESRALGGSPRYSSMGEGQPPGDRNWRARPTGLDSWLTLTPPPPAPLPPAPLCLASSRASWLRSSQFSIVVSRQHRVTSAQACNAGAAGAAETCVSRAGG